MWAKKGNTHNSSNNTATKIPAYYKYCLLSCKYNNNKITLKYLAPKQMIFVTNVKLRVHMPWTHKVQNLQLLKFFQLKYCSKYNNNYYYQLKDMQLTEIDSKFVKSGSFSVVETKQISWLINVYFFLTWVYMSSIMWEFVLFKIT